MPLGRFILAIWKAISRTACLLPSFWWNCPSISWVTRWKGWQGSQLLGPFPWSTGHNPLTWTILGICQRMETWRHVQSCTEHLKQEPMQVTFQLLVVYLLVTLMGSPIYSEASFIDLCLPMMLPMMSPDDALRWLWYYSLVGYYVTVFAFRPHFCQLPIWPTFLQDH